MDFVRWLSIARTGLKGAILKNVWAPVMGSQKIIYRRPLKRWQAFNIHLNLAGWDDKWVYHLHWFERQGEVYAIGITKAMVWKKDHPVPIREVFRAASEEMEDKAPPAWIRELFAEDRGNLQRLPEIMAGLSSAREK